MIICVFSPKVPVFAGSDQGLVYAVEMDYFFGYDGFGDFDFPDAPDPRDVAEKSHAATAIASMVENNPGKIAVLATGPLTNIALALHLYPRLLEDVKELVFVGGSYQGDMFSLLYRYRPVRLLGKSIGSEVGDWPDNVGSGL